MDPVSGNCHHVNVCCIAISEILTVSQILANRTHLDNIITQKQYPHCSMVCCCI